MSKRKRAKGKIAKQKVGKHRKAKCRSFSYRKGKYRKKNVERKMSKRKVKCLVHDFLIKLFDFIIEVTLCYLWPHKKLITEHTIDLRLEDHNSKFHNHSIYLLSVENLKLCAWSKHVKYVETLKLYVKNEYLVIWYLLWIWNCRYEASMLYILTVWNYT